MKPKIKSKSYNICKFHYHRCFLFLNDFEFFSKKPIKNIELSLILLRISNFLCNVSMMNSLRQ